MFAAWYEKNGAAADVLQCGDLPLSALGAGDVRVKLYASGVNPSDVKTRQGRPLVGSQVIPHSDGAGVIEAVGEAVASSRIGERVWIWNGQWQRPFGTAAEYIVIPEALAVSLPSSCSFEAGACFGVPLLTAIQTLTYLGDIRDQFILVTGAASAVGDYVTQIAARDRGAKVIGTTGSPSKAEHALAAGAYAAIDYKTESVADKILAITDGAGVSAVIDMDFSTTAPLASTGCFANHAKIVSYGSNKADQVSIPYREFMFRCLSLHQFAIYAITPAQRAVVLAEAQRLLAAEFLRHSIAKQFSLNDIVLAHQLVERGGDGVPGNVVLTMA